MNFNQLRYFISVADHLNFTKAAQEHYIAQTAISQQIAALEKELGIPLFYRNSRTVHLTVAGEVFYKDAKLLISKSEAAINKAVLANSGVQGNLAIGFQGPNEMNFLPELIRDFSLINPKVKLKLIQDDADNLHEATQEGALDVSFRLSHGIDKIPELIWEHVYRDPFCAVVYPDHPLAKEQKINRSALANESFIFFDKKSTPQGFELMLRDCVNSGFLPNIVAEATTTDSMLIMVAAGMGITMLPRCFESYWNNTLRFIELEGENEYIELIIVRRKDNLNPTIPLFLKALKNHFACNENSDPIP